MKWAQLRAKHLTPLPQLHHRLQRRLHFPIECVVDQLMGNSTSGISLCALSKWKSSWIIRDVVVAAREHRVGGRGGDGGPPGHRVGDETVGSAESPRAEQQPTTTTRIARTAALFVVVVALGVGGGGGRGCPSKKSKRRRACDRDL